MNWSKASQMAIFMLTSCYCGTAKRIWFHRSVPFLNSPSPPFSVPFSVPCCRLRKSCRKNEKHDNGKSGDFDHLPLLSGGCVRCAPGNTSTGNEEDDDDHENVMPKLINIMLMPIKVMTNTTATGSRAWLGRPHMARPERWTAKVASDDLKIKNVLRISDWFVRLLLGCGKRNPWITRYRIFSEELVKLCMN